MKILQLCNKAPYPPNDGSSIAITALAEGLADNGVDVHLLAVNTKKHFKPDEKIPNEFKQKTHYQSIYKNTNTTVFGAFANLFSTTSYFVSRFYFKEFEAKLIETLKNTTFDVIQIDGVFMCTYISTIKKYSSATIVLRAHNVEHQIWERHLDNEKNSAKKIYLSVQNSRLKKFELNAFNLVDAIITITDDDKKNISNISNQSNIYTCLTGINLNQYQPVIKALQPLTVFHFASMDWMPNIEAVDWLLKDVWPIVLKQIPNANLVLAGRGMPEKFCKLSSSTLQVITKVNDSKEFYKTYDIMLVPLWSGSGLRIKLVEGMAYGKAIITTSIGAEGINYQKNKDLIIADNADAYADAIISLLNNQTIKEELQQSARNFAEKHFDYKKLASDLIDYYMTLKK
jgi:polysaccharide biosynthesis protein PslH